MTGKEINSCKKCIVCTGCGRGAEKKEGLRVISDFSFFSQGNEDGSSKKRYAPLRDTEEKALLVATDIGTTTIVMQLRSMETGEVLDTFRCVNPQRKYGADILSRIQIAEEIPGAAETMQKEVLAVLEQGLEQFSGVTAGLAKGKKGEGDLIRGMVIAANTTMVHLLMGYPVDTLGKAPFTSEFLKEIRTTVAGVDTVIMPGISAFVGGDIVAGLYAYGALASEATQEHFLFLDLGTNGEIVLGNQERMLATATAAGPAFEGRLDVNVWGADGVRFLAKLLEEGFVDETGLLAEEYFEEGISIGSTVMTRDDIRSIQLAKAAVRAGIQVLCEKKGMDRIDKVYLAGGFGYYLNPGDAVKIGLIPGELEAKCTAVGNAALEGAFCYGRERFCKNMEASERALEKATELIAKTEICNLAETSEFEKIFIESINLVS